MESFLFLSRLCKYAQSKDKTTIADDFLEQLYQTQSVKGYITTTCQNCYVVCLFDDLEMFKSLKQNRGLCDVKYNSYMFGRANKLACDYAMRLLDAVIVDVDLFLLEHSNKSHDTVFEDGNATMRKQCSVLSNAPGSVVSMLRVVVESTKLLKLHKFTSPFLESTGKPCVIFTGHGLGCSCAIIATILAEKYKSLLNVKCVTFGSPRLYDKEFLCNYQRLVHRNYNIVLEEDAITDFMEFKPYKPAPNLIVLGMHGDYKLKSTSCCANCLKFAKHVMSIDLYITALRSAVEDCASGERMIVGCISSPSDNANSPPNTDKHSGSLPHSNTVYSNGHSCILNTNTYCRSNTSKTFVMYDNDFG